MPFNFHFLFNHCQSLGIYTPVQQKALKLTAARDETAILTGKRKILKTLKISASKHTQKRKVIVGIVKTTYHSGMVGIKRNGFYSASQNWSQNYYKNQGWSSLGYISYIMFILFFQ